MKILIMSQKIKREYTPKRGPSKGSLKRQELFKKKREGRQKQKKKNDKMKGKVLLKRRPPSSKNHKLLSSNKKKGETLSLMGGALTKKVKQKPLKSNMKRIKKCTK